MRAIEELINLVSGKLGIYKHLGQIAFLEARLASLSVLPLLITTGALVVMLFATWLATMAFLGLGIYYFYPNPLFALGVIFVLHLILLASLLTYLAVTLKHMSFAKTRQFMSMHGKSYELEKKSPERNSSDGKKVALGRSRSRVT